jgi:chemotaxis protein CheD
MDIKEVNNIKHVLIRPGEHFVSNQNIIISTLLGSCISACLYDPVNHVVGMNHFLLSSNKYSRDLPFYVADAGRYGIHAMELIINGMLNLGGNKKFIKAKAFGGSSLYSSNSGSDNFFCVGEVNSRFILEFLKNDGFPLVACDLGGERGRVIRFSSVDYSVLVRKTGIAGISKLINKEKQYWQKSKEVNERRETETDIWL